MKKLFILLTMLIVGIGSSWATDVTVINNKQAPTTYGSLSGTTFTTNDASGMAGVTISGFTTTKPTNFSYGACLGVENSASGTITLSAPEGYKILAYSLTARSSTWSYSYTLTPSAGGSAVTTSTGGVNLSVSGLDAQTASFTYSASGASSFYIPAMTITIFPKTATIINVTYKLYESDGTTLVSSITKPQEANSAINVPSSLNGPQYYDYATSGTIGTEDCTITVTRTLKSGWAIALSDLSNTKKYNIQNNRGWWAVANGASEINSTTELNLATSTSDTKQQFAFLKYTDNYDNDNKGNVYDGYYLYSINVGKFAYIDGTKLSLSTLDAFSSPALSKVTFNNSTSSDYKYTAPTVVQMDGKSYGVHTTLTPDVYQYSPQLGDGGNASAIKEAGDFTPTTAMTALGNFLYPTLDSGDTYTFNIYQIDNTTPLYLSLTTSLESVQYVVTENGTNTEGRTVYSLKNASTGKYLSYTNTTQSSDGSDTRLSWADNATNSKFLFSNAYNGRLAIRPAAASSTNYLTAWDIVSGKNVIFWNDANANNKNMSYWTVTKVGHPVTYNLIWNGETIKTNTVSSVLTGDQSSDYVPWSAPVYCSFSYDVETIESTTTEVNVTLNWNGPFEISSDFEHANWCYLKMHGQYLIYSGSTPYSLGDLAAAEAAGYNAFWAFVGNPVNGFKLINKAAGSDKNLELAWLPNMGTGNTKWFLQQWNNDFALHSNNLYLNNADGQLKLWVSGTSAEATNFDCKIESASYRGVALAYVDEYAASHHMGEYFGVDESSYNELVTTIKNVESITENNYNTLVSNINTQLSPKLPETGYYRIKSSGSRGGESYITYGYLDGSKGTGLLTTIGNKETDLGTVVKLTRVGTSKNYQISIQGLNVQAHSGDNTLFKATDATAVNFAFNHINHSGMCSIYDGTVHGNMHEADCKKQDTGLNGVVGLDAGDGTNASSWSVEDATTCTVTLNSDGATTPTYYATLCVPFDVTISDATAYTLAKSESGNYLVPTAVEDNKVPAGTPVLLKGTNATATATINTGDAFNSGAPLTCALTGTYVATTINTTIGSGNYVFGKKDSNVGFYHVNNENCSLKANRAYLSLGKDFDTSVGCRIMFDDVVTGIVSIFGETEEGAAIYNISGQRLNKIQKGINIVNGKKVLF